MMLIKEQLYTGDLKVRKEHGEDRIKVGADFVKRLALNADEIALLLILGIGDYMAAMGLRKAVEETHNLKVRYFAGRKDLAFLNELYGDGPTYVAFDAAPQDFRWAKEIKGGSTYYAHFPNMELSRMIGYGGITLLDAHKCRLGLARETEIQLPSRPPQKALIAARTRLSDLGLTPGKTVFISTKARSVNWKHVPETFWLTLARLLQSAGLGVCFLDNSAYANAVDANAIEVPLNEFRSLVATAGRMVCVRNGLCDLSLNLSIDQVAVYPEFFRIERAPVAEFGGANRLLEVSVAQDDTKGVAAAANVLSFLLNR